VTRFPERRRFPNLPRWCRFTGIDLGDLTEPEAMAIYAALAVGILAIFVFCVR
jgi:hypothetical protein